ncbi:cell wall protein TIR4 [Girardinichthys multiradiatus]|uniref:cell wall protein TIR4 n=1 Tax=Girardinichthys multiradiatus TaxID=208333 RepID=UPI001FAC76F7|nr:cell wall protein TIR4 [Girardinichthys multiradiatus]
MDKGLILSVLLVVLSWEFMATYTQTPSAAPNNVTSSNNLMWTNNASTVAPANDTSTVAPANITSTVAPANNASTVAPTNDTSTVAPANITSTVAPANITSTVAPANNVSTMTPANNASTVVPANNATTMAPANNASTVGADNNVTASANNSTTVAQANVTTATSGNVPAIAANISRQGCRSTKLCAAEPTECNPAAGDNCYFLSVKQKINQTFDFELSGQAAGYIAAGLSTAANQAGNHRAYICANNNGGVKFFTATLDNFVLNFTESLDSSNQRGTVNGGKIHCTFTAVLPDTTTRAAGYALSISTGTFNATTGKLGRPDFRLLTALVNLSDPTVNITNLLNSNTTSSAFLITPTHGSFLPALLVTVCMLAFTAM